MYRYRRSFLAKEHIYIAGPECFYSHGYELLAAMRKSAEAEGFAVTLPNDHPLDLDNPDQQKRADSIFADLAQVMNETTVMIADLEAFRGAEPDSGTVYELGMAYAKGAKCYGYTRDKRSLASRNQQAVLREGILYDESGGRMPYPNLPFSPTVIGSTKIVEGRFDDCLRMLITDLEEEQKRLVLSASEAGTDLGAAGYTTAKRRPVIYLAGFERYQADAELIYREMKALCGRHGYDALSPRDRAQGAGAVGEAAGNPYLWAAGLFDNWQRHVRNCDIIIANLNNYRGYEVCNDVGFECGMGFQLGKKLYGYMADTSRLTDRIPHLGADREYRDQTGSNVEDFDYPVNLMFGSSMKIFEGGFEAAVEQIMRDLKPDGGL